MAWKLISRTKDGEYNKYKKENEETFLYQETETGREVKFGAHPNRAFNYICYEGLSKDFNYVLEKYIKQGFKQREYPGGFDEAIRELP